MSNYGELSGPESDSFTQYALRIVSRNCSHEYIVKFTVLQCCDTDEWLVRRKVDGKVFRVKLDDGTLECSCLRYEIGIPCVHLILAMRERRSFIAPSSMCFVNSNCQKWK